MKTKTYLLILALLTIVCIGFAQNKTGSVKVTVTDAKSKQALAFANVTLYIGKTQKYVATTDIDGNAFFRQIVLGKYNIKVFYVGYQSKTVKDVVVYQDKTSYLTITLIGGGADLKEVVIAEYNAPLIDPDTKSGATISRETYQHKTDKSKSGVMNMTPCGVSNYNATSGKKVRGSRVNNTGYFINGEHSIRNTEDYNSEEYGSFKESVFNSVTSQPLSTFAIDVDGASYSNTRRMLQQGILPQKDVVRVEEFINYFHYNYPKPKEDKPFSISTEYAICPWNKDHNLLQIGIKGKEIDFENAVASHLVFLIDVSGSMESEDKLPLLKRAFKLLVNQLRPKDKLSIVVYAGSSGLILEAVSGDEKSKINDALEVLTAGGSTAGGEGINLAYAIAEKHFLKNGNNRVILATDGDFNVGVSSEKGLENLIEEKRNKGIYLSVLGFGQGNIKDNKMETLADKGNGNYYYIDNFMEARKVLVSQFGGTLYAIAKDVKIQIEFNPAIVKEYRLVGYDNRLLNAEDFNDDKKDAGELGSGHCVTALYEIIPVGSSDSKTKIDELKYSKVSSTTLNSTEMATVKFRYKDVKKQDTTSKLISEVVQNKVKDYQVTSENFKLATGVTEFALLLRESEYKGTSNFKEAIELASAAKVNDTDGYIAGLIEMMQIAKELKGVNLSRK